MDPYDPRWAAVEAECTHVDYEAAKALRRAARRRRHRGAPTAEDMAWRRDVVDGVVWQRTPAARPTYRQPAHRGAATAAEGKEWMPILYHDWTFANHATRKAVIEGNSHTDDGTPHSLWPFINGGDPAFCHARQRLFVTLMGVAEDESIEDHYAFSKRAYEDMVEDAFGDTPKAPPEPYDNVDAVHCAYIVPG